MCRKVSTQTTVQQENHTASGGPKLRTAERSRIKRLEFLDEKPSFRPKIIHKVPDFSRLHKALQTEVLKKAQIQDVTKCQPFCLRTSALPARQSRMSPENPQVKLFQNSLLWKCVWFFFVSIMCSFISAEFCLITSHSICIILSCHGLGLM